MQCFHNLACLEFEDMVLLCNIGGFPKIRVPFWGGPHNKDCNILGSIFVVRDLGKLSSTYPMHGSMLRTLKPLLKGI